MMVKKQEYRNSRKDIPFDFFSKTEIYPISLKTWHNFSKTKYETLIIICLIENVK
jgi:hypothetical protein